MVLAAVRNSGFALHYAAAEFREDKEVVMAAINESKDALQYASTALREDEEVMAAALSDEEAESADSSNSAQSSLNFTSVMVYTLCLLFASMFALY